MGDTAGSGARTERTRPSYIKKRRLLKLQDLPNSKRRELIDEWLHSELKRTAAKRHLIDGIPLEKIAEEVDRSPRQMARWWKTIKEELEKHI